MKWKYFGRTSGSGTIYEIFRCPNNGESIWNQNPNLFQRIRCTGEWEPDSRSVLDSEAFQGWFDEVDDEISEAEALQLIEKWKRGEWPGRS